MSHFSVGVITRNGTDDEVEELLAPFSEDLEVETYLNEDGEECTYNPEAKWDWWDFGGRWQGLINNNSDTAQLKDVIDKDFSTYAIVTPDGKWIAPGEVGWFGMSTATDNEEEQWFKNYSKLLASFDPSLYITIVDCHI